MDVAGGLYFIASLVFFHMRICFIFVKYNKYVEDSNKDINRIKEILVDTTAK